MWDVREDVYLLDDGAIALVRHFETDDPDNLNKQDKLEARFYYSNMWEMNDDFINRNKYKFASALSKIKEIGNLFPLIKTEEPPIELVNVVTAVSNELITYLKSHPKELYNLRPRQFEELIAEILASFGWGIILTPPTKDGGYDIFAIVKDISGVNTSWIIECKKWASKRKVGIDIARSLYAVKGELKAANAMIATTSYFTKGVEEFKTSRYDFAIRDYEGVLEWINTYRPNPNGRIYIKNKEIILPKKLTWS